MDEQKFKSKLSKIVCTLCEYYSELNNMCSYFNSYEDCLMFNKITEALLLSGIGDVSEYKHRAEVAERTLDFLCNSTMKDCNVLVFKDGIQVKNKVELYHYCMKRAEKELQIENEQM